MNEFSVLVVEDNLVSKKLFTEILENAGYEVFTATDGAMAFHLLKYVSFPLVQDWRNDTYAKNRRELGG